jgi:hypothetical protein
MNTKAIILSAILGISTPAIIDMAIPSQAMAVQKFNYPNNTFSDKEWTVFKHEFFLFPVASSSEPPFSLRGKQ